MKAIHRFTVRTILPKQLQLLDKLARNVHWAWHEPTQNLFRSLSEEAWRESGENPLIMLGLIPPERLARLAEDSALIERAGELLEELNRYCELPRWYQKCEDAPPAIAYFSPEFGITEALPQYSGGLGILAGDHLKSASDLGLPLIGVGLFYAHGYFAQSIGQDGWQRESYPHIAPGSLPLTQVRYPDGHAARVALALPEERTLHASIWEVMVGRVHLLLLDTDIEDNDEELRGVTDRLYGGDSEHRLRQELLLGIGGVRALRVAQEALGYPEATVFHTNEGHAGFQGLERIRELVGQGLSFEEALTSVRAGTVFTTHTPVAAGIDRFEMPLMESYVGVNELLAGLEAEQVLALGAESYQGGDPEVFNMAVLGLRLSQHANGVAKLHGRVSRAMFAPLWPGFDPDDVPISSVTNGVHAPTWTDSALVNLATSRLGTSDTTAADWQSSELSDGELWAVRSEMRARLVSDARRRLRAAAENAGELAPEWVESALDPAALTVGFARRGASYKRLTLMLHDRERFRRILLNPERPVQFVIAGKSHPADDEGKHLIQELVRFAAEPDVRGHIVFLPNYDIQMARTLYPGTDVWLNNPLRPMEACGTSGMKAALNGSLNLSILDGWWDEYYDGSNGWAIPSADGARDAGERDALEATALYELLEQRVVPSFYDRDGDGVPRAWMANVRHSLAVLSPELSADRMVRQYVEELYIPAGRLAVKLAAEDYRRAREFTQWKAHVRQAWPDIAVHELTVSTASGVGVGDITSEEAAEGVEPTDDVPAALGSDVLDESDTPEAPGQRLLGETLRVRARVVLGDLTPEDVRVQFVYGVSDDSDNIVEPRIHKLGPVVAGKGGKEGKGVTDGTQASAVPATTGAESTGDAGGSDEAGSSGEAGGAGNAEGGADVQAVTYETSFRLARAGTIGYTVRVLPRHKLLTSPAELALVTTA